MSNKIKIFLLIFLNLIINTLFIHANNIRIQHTANDTQPKAIFFDLGGTLVKPNKMGIANKIGTGEFVKYFFKGHNPAKIKDHIFRTLECISNNNQPNLFPTKSEDVILPDIMCKWLAGKKTGAQIAHEVDNWIKRHSKGFYSSSQQAKLVNRSIKIMLDPQILAKNMYPIKKALRILEECKKQVDKNGKPLHKLFILSNIDPLTYDYFKNTPEGREVFKHFPTENIVISGNIGLIKPHPDIYNYVLNKYKLNPKNCLLIDDQEENIESAIKVGMQGIHIKNGNFSRLRSDLINLKVI